MPYNPHKHHRRSIRLKGYDYSQGGAYFITICTENRDCLLGEIIDGEMKLSGPGCLIEQCWRNLPQRFPCVSIDEFIVMPNHFHGILWINNHDDVGAPFAHIEQSAVQQNKILIRQKDTMFPGAKPLR